MELKRLYKNFCEWPTDINEHLPTLRRYTEECNSVVECGVRDLVSSYAFAVGLLGNAGNSYVLVDPYKSAQIDGFLNLCKEQGVNASFYQGSDLTCPLLETDLLFIDTWHVYGQLKRELEYWHASVKKFIILHDTTLDGVDGESLRYSWDAEQQSKDTGIPVEEIKKGIWPAVEEFLSLNTSWKLKERFENNNGLTILEKIN